MIDVLKVQKYLADMYSESEVSEGDIKKLLSQYPERAKLWEEEFKDNNTEEVLISIRDYWKYKDSKVKPKIVHIKAMMATKDEYVDQQKDYSELARAAARTAKQLRQKAIDRFGN